MNHLLEKALNIESHEDSFEKTAESGRCSAEIVPRRERERGRASARVSER